MLIADAGTGRIDEVKEAAARLFRCRPGSGTSVRLVFPADRVLS